MRAYRRLGGIGYILAFILYVIPLVYVYIVAAILVAIALIMMGRDTDQRLFTITGVLMTLVAMDLAWAIFAMALRIPAGFLMRDALALTSMIAEIASHFRASRIFQNTWFKVAGWLRVIALIIAIPVVTWSVGVGNILRYILAFIPYMAAILAIYIRSWSFIIVAILGIPAVIFSVIAFFTIPEDGRYDERGLLPTTASAISRRSLKGSIKAYIGWIFFRGV